MPLKGYKQSKEHVDKLKIVRKGFLGHKHTEKTKNKIGLGQRGKKNAWFGKKGNEHPKWKGGKEEAIKRGAIKDLKHFEKLTGRKKPKNCDICESNMRICFDHCHESGEFRGWLCTRCNLILGHAKDDKKVLKLIIKYLEKHGKRRKK